MKLEYLTDGKRHLICRPFSIVNLHKMAKALKIDKCWFHNNKRKFPHYDIPKLRIKEIERRCRFVTVQEIVLLIKETNPPIKSKEMNIGKAIREVRNLRGLNQTVFAKSINITQTALSQIESGSKRPHKSTIQKIVDVYQIPEFVLYLIATQVEDIPTAKQMIFESDLFVGIKKTIIDSFV